MMSGCGVRSRRRCGKLKGFQKNKNKIKTSLWQGFKGGNHIQEQLFGKKKKSTITSRFVLGSAGGSKEEWWMAMRLSSRPMFTGRPFVPTHLASSSLKEARRFLATSQTTLLWGGSNSCFTLGSSLPRKTKNTSFPSETAGRAEH